MKPETTTALLKDLQKLQKTLVASQIDAVRRDPALGARLARLHAEAEVGGRVDDFVANFAKGEFFSTRGKLNVPRERFILFAELAPQRFGWNGWRDRERALAEVESFTLAESDPHRPVPVPTSEDPRRCGVTFGLWESLPDVKRWGAAAEHAELQDLAREACRQPRCPCPIVDVWKDQVLHGKAREDEPRKGKKPATVSLAERAWVVGLFKPHEDTDAAGVFNRHKASLAGPSQLTMPGVGTQHPPEVVALDESRLALVLDDLVASGHLDVAGRGKKKRYSSVPRGVSS